MRPLDVASVAVVRRRRGVGRFSLEDEHGPLHSQEALVHAPAVARVRYEDHIRTVEMPSLEQRDFAAAHRAAFSRKNGSSVPATRYARGNRLGITSGGRYPAPGDAEKIAP